MNENCVNERNIDQAIAISASYEMLSPNLFFSFVSILSFNYWESCTKITISTVSLFSPVLNQTQSHFFCQPKSYFRILNAINCCHYCMKIHVSCHWRPLVLFFISLLAFFLLFIYVFALYLRFFFHLLSILCNLIEPILMSLNFWLKGQWTYSSVILKWYWYKKNIE